MATGSTGSSRSVSNYAAEERLVGRAAEGFAELNDRFDVHGRVYVVEPWRELEADPEAMRTGLLLQAEPHIGSQLQAHIGDLFGRFTCRAAKVVTVLEERTRGKPLEPISSPAVLVLRACRVPRVPQAAGAHSSLGCSDRASARREICRAD